jgi:DNA polymerase-1
MGPCIYTPGQKNAYIPINHINPHTRERLEWQLTEEDIFEAFDKLNDTLIVMHNGKFDYQVIKCTTGKQLKVYWDTMLGSRILNENEKRAGLKEQYIDKVDSSIEKYSIEHLFEGLEYAIFDPELFALYAATDAYMTYKLYLWQKKQFERVEHQKLYKLFLEVEMPIMEVAAEMELYGIEIDHDYAKILSAKYHTML